MCFLLPHWVPTIRVLRRISRFSRSITLSVRMRVRCSLGKSQYLDYTDAQMNAAISRLKIDTITMNLCEKTEAWVRAAAYHAEAAGKRRRGLSKHPLRRCSIISTCGSKPKIAAQNLHHRKQRIQGNTHADFGVAYPLFHCPKSHQIGIFL